MMEIQRHTNDIEHPMYEIIDNACDGYKIIV